MSKPSASKTNPGNFFEDFRLGQQIRHATPRTVTAGDVAVYQALFGPAFCGAVLRHLRAGDRLRPSPARRPAGLPRGVRQDRAGHLAQRGGQSRLCRLPLPQSRLSGRHAQRGVGGDRAAGKRQPQDRHRLCALARLRRDGRLRARLCALGDGAQARRGGRGAAGNGAGAAQGGGAGAARRRLPEDRRRRLRHSSLPAARTASATTRRARESTTPTASRSRKPST